MIWGGTLPLCGKKIITVKLFPLAERRGQQYIASLELDCVYLSRENDQALRTWPARDQGLEGVTAMFRATLKTKLDVFWEKRKWNSYHLSPPPRLLQKLTSCCPLSLTHQFTTSFHFSQSPRGQGALLSKWNWIPKTWKSKMHLDSR